jgi:hypothetical protein
MRLTKMVTLLIALVVGGLTLHLNSANRVQAADGLQDTYWSDSGDDVSVEFKQNGKVHYEMTMVYGLDGDYRLNGSTVEFSFVDEGSSLKGTGTISGNKMTLRGLFNEKSFPDGLVVTKKR